MWTSFWCDNCLGSSVCHPMRSIPPPTLSNGRARKGKERVRKGKPAICLLDWILHVCKIESRKLLWYPYTHCMFTCTSIHGNEQKERELTQKERKLRQNERERLLLILYYKSCGLAIALTLASLARPRSHWPPPSRPPSPMLWLVYFD